MSLKAFTHLLPTRFDDPEFRTGLVRVADRGIFRIDELRGRFGSRPRHPAQPMGLVDLLDPLQSALELLLSEREARRCTVATDRDSLLEQIFHILCLNAIGAMTAGGELTVRVADLCEAGESSLLVEISGLGLTICSPVADADRAILTARKQIGRAGCAFAIEFPVPDRRPPKLHI